jgi:hypothetical protein
MLLARRFTLNPVLVIISLVFWFWMWGIPGAILSVPMLAITKIICDSVRPLERAAPPFRRSPMVLYFVCPHDTNRLASVLWMPPGAHAFASRKSWGRRVAYASQFLDRDNRAHRGQAKIRTRLCSIGGFDPEEWELPPKPKWMRTRTYRRAEAKFDRYNSVLDSGIFELAARLGMKL